MASSSKEIQRRIKSIKNTAKITRAMEMVAAAKMKKEVDRVLSVRSYANLAWKFLTNLSRAFEKQKHGLLEVRPVKNILVILITSNRGLCGGYNSQLLKKLMAHIENPESLKINRVGKKKILSPVANQDLNFEFIAVGKKGFDYLNRRYKVVALFDDLNYYVGLEDVRALAKLAIDDYIQEKYDKVVIAYTDYVNPLLQLPKLRQLLPISKIDLEKHLEEMRQTEAVGEPEKIGEEKEKREEELIDYKIEPEPKKIVNEMLPRLVEMQLYHSILESNASKESARMMTMRNATEAAGEMVADLQYTFNQMRQAGITQEIAEITSGQVALE